MPGFSPASRSASDCASSTHTTSLPDAAVADAPASQSTSAREGSGARMTLGACSRVPYLLSISKSVVSEVSRSAAGVQPEACALISEISVGFVTLNPTQLGM